MSIRQNQHSTRQKPLLVDQKTKPATRVRQYPAKRDFSRSPEPDASRRHASPGRRRLFCIQKHLASHLHYDFRLEHHGVLLSWAVPKGPSTDPAVRRLAMQVEDHPLAYGHFEGVIQSGYGAGVVLLWDVGGWMPLVDDVDAALSAGKLPFMVSGEKIKGHWLLVRSAHVGPQAWLLMKQKDQWARPEDITDMAPRSVLTNDDFAGILARQQTNPWQDKAPVLSGETGRMFRNVMAGAKSIRARGGHGAATQRGRLATSQAKRAMPQPGFREGR